MNNRIKSAFDTIHADEALKQNTRNFLSAYRQEARKQVPHAPNWFSLLQKDHSTRRPFALGQSGQRTFAGACDREYSASISILLSICLLLTISLVGSLVFFTPVSSISVDVNPSVELGINRFDRVVSIKGYNEDGMALADAVNVRYKTYTDALDTLMQSDQLVSYLENDGLVSITVLGTDDQASAKMLNAISSCHYANAPNVTCQSGHREDMEAAHEAGLSFGKYEAYLELQSLDPDVTPEDVQNLTMRQIQDRIDACGGKTNVMGNSSQNSCGHGRHHNSSH